MKKKNLLPLILGIILGFFGLATLFLSTSVIFDLFGIREKEGNYVLFVVVANFLVSILYLISAYGIMRIRKWANYLLWISVFILTIAFLGLLLHIQAGGVYEMKTIPALVFRTSLTIVFALIFKRFVIDRKDVAAVDHRQPGETNKLTAYAGEHIVSEK